MDTLFIMLSAGAGLAGVSVGLYVGSWLLRRAVREVQYGLADVEARLIREVRRRAADARWEEEEKPPSSPSLVDEVKKGFLHPAEFARRKSERRMKRGTEARPLVEENRQERS